MSVTLRQTGLTDVVIEAGYTFPINKNGRAFQVIARRGNGTPQVAKLAPSEEIWTLLFRQVTQAERNAIFDFITNALVDYSLFPFTFIDFDATEYSAQYMLSELNIPESTDGNFEWRPQLRVVAI